jgi:hypothetical protein
MEKNKTEQYLISVTMPNFGTFRKTFKTQKAMKDYIKARDFYFVNADYSTYDLAIKVK